MTVDRKKNVSYVNRWLTIFYTVISFFFKGGSEHLMKGGIISIRLNQVHYRTQSAIAGSHHLFDKKERRYLPVPFQLPIFGEFENNSVNTI